MSDDLKERDRRSFERLDWATGLVAALVLAVAVGAIYHASIEAPLIYDDQDTILINDSITRLWPLSSALVAPTGFPTAGRPLVNLSFALNYHFGALHTFGYHLVNMVLHALSALLLFGILRRTLRLPFFADRFDAAATPLALAVALVWAVHPLQTESVVYITQRTELMVGFFYLATLYASLRYWLAESSIPRRTWLVTAVLASLCGMASKEVMVSAPLMVLLFDRTFVSSSFRRAIAGSWPLYVGLASTWGLLLALNLHGPRSESAGFHLADSVQAWWLTQTKVVWIYLKLAFWPWPLSIHYEMPYLTLPDAWPYVLATAAIAMASLVLLWRGYAAGFVGVWVFAILSPTLVVPIITEVAAERRMYLPLAGIVALVIVGVYGLAQRYLRSSDQRWLWSGALASVIGLCFVLGMVSHWRLAAYESSVTLWQDFLAHHPDSYFGHDHLGYTLVSLGRYEESLEHFHRSLEIKPDYDFANFNLGGALMSLDRYDEAIAQFQKALTIEENVAPAHWNLGAMLCKTGKVAEGIEHFERALEIRPQAGQWHFELAEILVDVGFKGQAFVHYEKAAALLPQHTNAQLSFAVLLQRDGRIDEAVPHYERAVALDPKDATKRRFLANVLLAQGRAEEALVQLREAARLAPEDLEIWISLAECHQSRRHATDAVAAADRALEIAKAGEDRQAIARCEELLTKCRAGLANPGQAPVLPSPDTETTP